MINKYVGTRDCTQERKAPTILDKIAEKTRLRVARSKMTAPLEQVQKKAFALLGRTGIGGLSSSDAPLPFDRAISTPGLSFICEVKKASPSKGIIATDFPYLEIAAQYEAAGASAISVLTEPEYFLGSDQYLREIAAAVKIPALRKDFIVDPYQIYEAKLLGAEAVLFICALLDAETLTTFIKIANEIQLSALVEIHNETELDRALNVGARIIGINNRDLKTFKVDFETSARLRALIPAGIITVAESGVSTPDDVRQVKKLGFSAVLIGESLMRSADKKRFLAELSAAGSAL